MVLYQSHYDRLKNTLLEAEQEGKDITEAMNKLNQITLIKESTQAEMDFNSVVAEIEGIIEFGNSIGSPHYNKLVNGLAEAEKEGIDTQEARELLEQVPRKLADPSTGSDDIKFKLPECEGKQYTVAPVDLNELQKIFPRGGVNPPGHTIPTDHPYLFISSGQTSLKMVPLSAPGDIYITSISSDEDDIVPERTEYVIWFSLCKDVHGYYNHVKDISDDLKAALSVVECEDWSYNPGNICSKQIFKEVKAGTVIGQVGHKQGNFDFGTYDHRILLDFANKYRYGQYDGGETGPRGLHMACAFDYYEPNLKEQLYAKLDNSKEPKCGETMHDIKGTLQGNWFAGESSFADPSTWTQQLAFVKDVTSNDLIISIAGGFTDVGKWFLTPKDSGKINRKFSDVTNDGSIYCYQTDVLGTNQQSKPSGKIIVQLTSDTRLKIEHQSGSCSGSSSFNNPTTYNR